MSKQMSNAPVYYALAQAQFNPVAAMGKYVDEIQDRLRRAGYPLFKQQHSLRLDFPGPGQPAGMEPRIQPALSWLMTRSDESAGFILASSGITFHTTRYQTHREFIPELLRGLTAVHEVVELDHVSRLGLRYLDAVLPREGESVGQYLVGGLRGIEFSAAERYMMAESMFATQTGPLVREGSLLCRVFRMTAPLGFPPDLQPSGLAVEPRFRITDSREHGVIDTDHYVEGHMAIEMEKLDEQLLSLHAAIKSVFAAAVTRHAHKAWA